MRTRYRRAGGAICGGMPRCSMKDSGGAMWEVSRKHSAIGAVIELPRRQQVRSDGGRLSGRRGGAAEHTIPMLAARCPGVPHKTPQTPVDRAPARTAMVTFGPGVHSRQVDE